MKKKLLLLSLAAFLGIGLVSCGGGSDPTVTPTEDPTEEPTETPTETPTEQPTEVVPLPEEDAVWFHYHRPEGDYEGWGLWLWERDIDGNHIAFDTFFEFNDFDDYGAICKQPLSLWGNLPENDIALIVRDANWGKDPDGDRFLNLSDYTPDENNVYHIYLVSGDSTIYDTPAGKDMDIVKSAAFITTSRIVVKVNHILSAYTFYENNVVLKEWTAGPEDEKTTADVNLPEEGNFNSEYKCVLTFRDSGRTIETGISTQPLFKTQSFDAEYTYDGELGALYTKESTTFKVWSPVSTEILLNIYDVGTSAALDPVRGSNEKTTYSMEKGEKGVWEYTVPGDLNGKYYTYTVTNANFDKREIVDPYAKSAGVNGKRGMIIDFNDERALPEGWNEASWSIHPRSTMTVWETHVSDVTSHESWTGKEENRLKFNGVIEKGTKYTEDGVTISTGFDHIKELGVNTVQFVPVYDQDNIELDMAFNWGYNPLNYNVIEGQYSSDPHDGYVRVKEFRNLVKTFNEEGINVIMDVVYNHVSSIDNSNFNVLMPGYYFRYSGGKPTSGSGCGNDTASEMPMMRKFIKDSTLFLAETYKLSGYRFDLMGLHDVETMNQVVDNLQDNYNKDIVVYGEPWNMSTGTTAKLAHQGNMADWDDFGGFNDKIRDAIKGSVFDQTSTGWATDAQGLKNSNYDHIITSLKGGTPASSKDPAKNVAYVSCHDNNTIFDKMKLSVTSFDNANPVTEAEMDPAEFDKAAHLSAFCNSFVFASQGISFMNAGEEMLRTKLNADNSLNENSYNATYECNELDYTRKIAHEDIFNDYQFMIEGKQSNPGLHYLTATETDTNITTATVEDKSYIDMTVTYVDNGQTVETRIIFASAQVAAEGVLVDVSGYDFVGAVSGSEVATEGNSVRILPGSAYYYSRIAA